MVMRKSIKGFYTLEAVIVLPVVVLTVLSLGYFMKVEGAWENSMHIAFDESSKSAAEAYPTGIAVVKRYDIENRIMRENPEIESVEVSRLLMGYSDSVSDKLTSFNIRMSMNMELPMGFSRKFNFQSRIKYRGFVGKKVVNSPMGTYGLEEDVISDPVSIFPMSGEKYHDENCTYVKAAVSQRVLTSAIKSKYKSCNLCNSSEVPAGSIVFCFTGDDTAYHKGTCRTIRRHTAVIDKSDARRKGYSPCSKCGG